MSLFKRMFISDTSNAIMGNLLEVISPYAEKVSKYAPIKISSNLLQYYARGNVAFNSERLTKIANDLNSEFSTYTKIRKPDANYKPYEISNEPETYKSVDIKSLAEKYNNIYGNEFTKRIISIVPAEFKERAFNRIIGYTDDLNTLVTKYNYDPKTLLHYLIEEVKWQGLTGMFAESGYGWNDSPLVILRDYAKMSYDILGSTKFDKYPQYLKTVHDIVAMNFKLKEDEIMNNKARDRFNSLTEMYAFKDNDYIVVIPETMQDIQKEGTNQHHCVASYAENHCEGKTSIIFFRKIDTPEESLLTVEIMDDTKEIKQVKGFGNRQPNEEESKFVEKFKKHLQKKFFPNVLENETKEEAVA